MRFFLDLSYKGTNYHGWQIQPNGNTVQAELQTAISTVLRTEISITGSGRTDTGVHASQQIAHFDFDKEEELEYLVFKLNSLLPPDISIHSIRSVNEDAHARFGATKRTYHYHITKVKDPFKTDVAYYFNQPLDLPLIEEACKIIGEWENFECFSKVHTEVNNFNCSIYSISWSESEDRHLFAVQANRFLRGMVRAMVGTLLDVGLGKTSLEDLKNILKSNDRSSAGRAVPAHGLFLEQVEYPEAIYL